MQATRTVKLRCVKYGNEWEWGLRDSGRQPQAEFRPFISYCDFISEPQFSNL